MRAALPWRWVVGANLVLLFAVTLWYRVSSLGGLPTVDGDEVWHAVQLTRMLKGEPLLLSTAHGLPLSPFHAALELPLLLAVKPALWVVRVPTVLTGILAVILTYVLGSRMLDRTTALIAATLLAVLPVAIVFARTSYESSHAPLYIIVLIYLAWRLRTKAVVVLLLFAYFVHPFTILILPVLLAVMLASSFREGAGGGERERLALLGRMAAVSGAVLAIGLFTLLRPSTDRMITTYKCGPGGPHDWFEFGGWFGRLFLVAGREPRPWHDRIFWTVLLAVLVPGTILLVRRRQWDRVGLVAGTTLSATAMFVVGGSTILQPGMTRYGLFLVVPAVLGFACLVTSLRVGPGADGRRVALDRLQVVALVAMAWVVLLSFRMEEVTVGRIADGIANPSRDSIWTFSSEPDPRRRALAGIMRDIRASGGGEVPRVVLADDWNDYYVLAFLASPRRSVRVVFVPELSESRNGNPPDVLANVREIAGRGGYGIGPPGGSSETLLRGLFPAELLDRWDVSRYGQAPLSVYRLKAAGPPVGFAAIAERARARR